MYKKYIKFAIPVLIIVAIFSISLIWHSKEIDTKNNQSINDQQTNSRTTQDNQELKYTNEESQTWKIEIPAISLTANISEGTDEENLNKYVGHFSATPKAVGNIGLAAHNRGYAVNYFENLKKLKGGEEVKYTYKEISKTYIVVQNIKISDIDWSYLENSNENKITLITCLENEPTYRRCVQAVEREEI